MPGIYWVKGGERWCIGNLQTALICCWLLVCSYDAGVAMLMLSQPLIENRTQMIVSFDHYTSDAKQLGHFLELAGWNSVEIIIMIYR